MTPADLLARELRRDPGRPLVTWYDDASGARVELSVATAANWAAKLANLLVDEHDVGPGVDVGVRLPARWHTSVLLLGIWLAGGCAAIDAEGPLAFELDPIGAGLAQLAAAQPDAFVPVTPVDPDAAALRVDGREWSHHDLATAAERDALTHGLDSSSRVLSTLGYDTATGLDAGLLVPLAAGGSVVLVENPAVDQIDDRCRTEKVTHTAGVAVAGLPVLTMGR